MLATVTRRGRGFVGETWTGSSGSSDGLWFSWSTTLSSWMVVVMKGLAVRAERRVLLTDSSRRGSDSGSGPARAQRMVWSVGVAMDFHKTWQRQTCGPRTPSPLSKNGGHCLRGLVRIRQSRSTGAVLGKEKLVRGERALVVVVRRGVEGRVGVEALMETRACPVRGPGRRDAIAPGGAIRSRPAARFN